MKRIYIPLTLLLIFFLYSCEKQESISIVQEEEIQDTEVNDCTAGLLCIPPFEIDTSCVQMQMLRDSIFYKPTSNFTCIVPHLTLPIDQIWVNGSIAPAQTVVTLLMSDDVEVGSYPILDNSAYDAFYVPTIGADNFVAISGTLNIVEHDTIDRFILGGFDFIAQNLNSPVLPTVEFKDGCFQAYY
ncbi:MAG TPA: hypothetical protein ENK85_06225 [Saprospiraceae bacterium]|nr:hypothetical protein [Saprospiraceae bacterium]